MLVNSHLDIEAGLASVLLWSSIVYQCDDRATEFMARGGHEGILVLCGKDLAEEEVKELLLLCGNLCGSTQEVLYQFYDSGVLGALSRY